MTRARGHLVSIAAAVLSMQALVLALGMARVCSVPDHTHRGRPAPDCRMHHQSPPGGGAHARHVHGESAAKAPLPDAQISCKCASSVFELFGGGVAVLTPGASAPARIAAALPVPASIDSSGRTRVPPLLPPPRPLPL